MKTRRLAMAAERGRVGVRRAQAWGLVSRIMVRREGGGSEEGCECQYDFVERVGWMCLLAVRDLVVVV